MKLDTEANNVVVGDLTVEEANGILDDGDDNEVLIDLFDTHVSSLITLMESEELLEGYFVIKITKEESSTG